MTTESKFTSTWICTWSKNLSKQTHQIFGKNLHSSDCKKGTKIKFHFKLLLTFTHWSFKSLISDSEMTFGFKLVRDYCRMDWNSLAFFFKIETIRLSKIWYKQDLSIFKKYTVHPTVSLWPVLLHQWSKCQY